MVQRTITIVQEEAAQSAQHTRKEQKYFKRGLLRNKRPHEYVKRRGVRYEHNNH